MIFFFFTLKGAWYAFWYTTVKVKGLHHLNTDGLVCWFWQLTASPAHPCPCNCKDWLDFSFFFLYIRLISGQVLLFIHHMEIMLNFELSEILELCLLGECPPQFSVVLLKVSVTFSFCPLSLFWHWDLFLSLFKLHVENKHIFFLFWLCLRCILVGKPSKR